MPTGVYPRTNYHKKIYKELGLRIMGSNNPNWKNFNRKSYMKEYLKKYREIHKEEIRAYLKKYRKNGEQAREYRHRSGISKRYISKYGGLKATSKEHGQRRKALMRGGGKLSTKTIQMVYEDNIKKYGTLTCYLCLKPVEFKQDSLEHKQPLSRGGTNEYNNLAIAHKSCNSKKQTQTEEEYRRKICQPQK